MIRHFGEISDRDYRRITEPPWRRRVRAAGFAATAMVFCAICTAAGDYWGLWTGKGSRQLSYEQAMQILEEAPAQRWIAEIGMGAVQEHAERAIDAIHDTGQRREDSERYAGLYLRNLSVRGIQHIENLLAAGNLPSVHESYLQAIREELEN